MKKLRVGKNSEILINLYELTMYSNQTLYSYDVSINALAEQGYVFVAQKPLALADAKGKIVPVGHNLWRK